MDGWRYRGKISHTEKTVQRLYKTQFYTYSRLYSLIRMGIGMVLILAVFFASFPTWLRAILLLIGTWLVVSRDFPAQIRADRVLQARNASLPDMVYLFYDDRVVLSGEGEMSLPYERFTRLVRDGEYYYLFVSKDSVCMVDSSSVEPPEAEAFLKFTEEKTGLTWRREKPLLSMNLTEILEMFRDLRKK